MRMSMKTWIAVAALIAEWVRDGRLRYREDIVDGLQNCPAQSPDFTAEKILASGLSASDCNVGEAVLRLFETRTKIRPQWCATYFTLS
jgi:hypothetical protein